MGNKRKGNDVTPATTCAVTGGILGRVTPSPTSPAERSVVQEARRLLAEGRAWRARDVLTEHVEGERDAEALDLLAEVLQDMGDLPRAGAVWFATGAKGPQVDAAVAAWREQSGDDFGVMWASLPASVRAEPRPRRIEALRERARAARGDDASSGVAQPSSAAAADDLDTDEDEGFDVAWLTAWVLAVLFVVLAVIGFSTVIGWLVPG